MGLSFSSVAEPLSETILKKWRTGISLSPLQLNPFTFSNLDRVASFSLFSLSSIAFLLFFFLISLHQFYRNCEMCLS